MALGFRLLRDDALDGPTNMARDEAISRAVASGVERPTLRLYAWDPPCLSLGRGQPIGAVDQAACRSGGVDIVRRATGGRAVLHTDELTYSLTLPALHPIAAGNLITSYRRIARAIVEALRRLGVRDPGTEGLALDRRATGAVCFEAPSDYEVVGGGKKLVGSAQRRHAAGVLQHGSLPLCGDVARVCRYLIRAPEPAKVRAHAGSLAEVLGRPVTWDEAADAWYGAFADVLGISFCVGRLGNAEQDWTAQLRACRYAHDAWTRRR